MLKTIIVSYSGHSSLDSHVCALAAIFGWDVGEGEQVRAADVLAVM